ncbi:unnamed protein product [Staurois parvus]|uniref:Uncharacterized protein n=1 Tax=Staurois parvus TaxID=386267 RepID=A0ABN9HCM0_9NEOB|nr:unnamed protein product [Staurois parvus]
MAQGGGVGSIILKPYTGLGLKAEAVSSVSRRQRHMAQGGGGCSSIRKPKHRPRLKSGSRQQHEQTTEAHGAGVRQQQWKAIQHPITKWNPPTV